MTDTQQATYGDATDVYSDAAGLISRDNRNHRKKQDAIMDATHATAGDRVLEVGCGDGLHASRYARTYDYHGVDQSPGLVEACREAISHGEVREMDARELWHQDGFFDAVVGTAILHHLPDHEQALREWLRVVRPGGSVTLVEPNLLFPKALVSAAVVPAERHKRKMSPWRVRRLLDRLDVPYRHEPHVYTPPWPQRATGLFDRVDGTLGGLPGVRWASQLQLLHLEVPR